MAFDDWKKSQDQFQEDFQLWQDKSAEILGGLPQEVQDRIQAEPLSTRVWLASLGEGNLETAITELTDTYNLVSEGAKEEWQVKLPGVISEAEALIAAEMDKIEAAAKESGENVAVAWDTEFAKHAAKWDNTVRRYSSAAVGAFHGTWEAQSPSKVAIDLADNIANSFSSTLDKHTRAGDFGLPQGIDVPSQRVAPISQQSTTIERNVSIEINNPTAQSADRDVIKATVMDRLAGVI
jgi:hypothetical protein